ncbi:unnamed protein product [Schistocephalus solidus]|uniref:Uncharacterized protein n=1 Tax=Schistocephalus solidus TaxID=70667 RepID=A0A183STW7_SCHSO|nr:unnamed protein product [Schistocephalus solidus]
MSLVVNAPVAASSWYPTPICGSSTLGSSSGHTPGNHHDWRVKPGENLSGAVCTSTPASRGSQIEKYVVIKLKQITILTVSIPNAIPSRLLGMDIRTYATKAAFFRCRRLVRQRLRQMQETWMIRKAEEIQGYADHSEMKNFFKAIKAINGPCIKGTALLLRSDGTTLLTEKSQILKCSPKHFRCVLNRLAASSDAAIDRLPQVNTNDDLDLPPSLQETIRARPYPNTHNLLPPPPPPPLPPPPSLPPSATGTLS